MGPLQGVRVIELAGIGPTPFAGMMLSDLGAEVIRIDRVGGSGNPVASSSGPMERGKRAIAVDLKSPEGRELVLDLVASADVVLEGFRAGVAERLGVGPAECLSRNPNIVFGRMTGWGQQGPMAQRAGHDINYISLAGPLAHIGRHGQKPTVPLNLIGDFGGGSMFVVLGIVSALYAVKAGGPGQVVDAAMVDGSASLMAYMYGGMAGGVWKNERQSNNVDGGHWLYGMYRCADERFVSIACLSAKLYRNLETTLELDPDIFSFRARRDEWPALRDRLGAVFAQRTRDEWVERFSGTDACVQPVLDMEEAPNHPHLVERQTFVEHGGVVQPAPAPRFSKSPGQIQCQPPVNGQDTDDVLADWGFDPAEVAELRTAGAIGVKE